MWFRCCFKQGKMCGCFVWSDRVLSHPYVLKCGSFCSDIMIGPQRTKFAQNYARKKCKSIFHVLH